MQRLVAILLSLILGPAQAAPLNSRAFRLRTQKTPIRSGAIIQTGIRPQAIPGHAEIGPQITGELNSISPKKPVDLPQYANPREKELFEHVAETVGSILSEAEAPILYRTLGQVFEDLGAAQATMFAQGLMPVNRIFIVDAAQDNAFVYCLRETGVRKLVNDVFLTTGLIKKMLSREACAAALEQGRLRLAGIMAHELAHPFDEIDPEGIEEKWHGGDQAQEVRADAEGLMLLKQAGYPADSVYQSLVRLFEEDSAPRTAVGELLSSHPVYKHLYFMGKANGVSFDLLPAREKLEVGTLLVESSLRGLFRNGWFDPDRHKGNFLVDAENRTISLFDFGQAESFSVEPFWKSDDRYVLARFLYAMSRKDAVDIVRYGMSMSAGSASSIAALTARVSDALNAPSNRGSVSDDLIEVINTFGEHGLRFEKKFMFGAFKGLIVLYGEKYVGASRMKRLLTQEIGRLLKLKAPRYAADRLR